MLSQFVGPMDFAQAVSLFFLVAPFAGIVIAFLVYRVRTSRALMDHEVKLIHEKRIAKDTKLIDTRRNVEFEG